jgi:hypothetical protein
MHRREFLRAGSVPLLGLTLPHLLAARVPKRKAKALIVLFMWGGPAQQDTWDLKPEAPVEYRGEFKPINTNVPGIQICEHLPKIARMADRLALIRSMTHTDVNHTSATHFMLTGRGIGAPTGKFHDDWPSFGGVVSKLGLGKGPLPPFVSMMPKYEINPAPRFVEQSHGQGAGWLGPVHNPLRIDADASKPDYRVGDFSLSAEVPLSRTQRRRELLSRLDAQRRNLEAQAEVAAGGAHQERAFSILSDRKAIEAFDLSKEPLKVRERYGMNIHGQAVLQARRLVEAGVPLVTVFWQNDGQTNVSVYWDTHNRNFIDLKTRLCPVTDQAFTALISDLESRGMLDETLILWTGEMGRTPKVAQSVPGGAGAGRDGRDHWAKVFTSVLVGGGIKGGVVHGSSDRYAAEPATNPTAPADLAATVYHCLGIDPEMQLRDRLDRPLTLCEGRVIEGIVR